MLNYFLNFAFLSDERKGYQVVSFDESKFGDFNLEYFDELGLIKLRESMEGKARFDFSIKSGYLVWDGTPVAVSEEDREMMVNMGNVAYRNVMPTIYDILHHLNQNGAVYVSSKLINGDKVTEPAPNNDVANFVNLRVSRSTLSINLAVVNEEGWRTRTILQLEDNQLKLHPFHFALETELMGDLLQHPAIEKVGDIELWGKSAILARVNSDALIYPVFDPQFTMAGPLLNYRAYLAERSRVSSMLMNRILKSLLSVESPEVTPRYDYVRREDSHYNILLTVHNAKVSTEDYHRMSEAVTRIFEGMVTGKITSPSQELNGYGFDNIKKYACVATLMGMLDASGKPLRGLDITDKLHAQRRKLQQINIANELELFMYRAYIYYNNYPFLHGTANMFMRGGNSPYLTEFTKKIKGWY